jgi:hypothetical protein
MKKTGLEKDFKFDCNTPCKTCPYRKDAVLRLWAKEEFERLLESESDFFGVTYGCHKKTGSICVGWLMDQDRRNHPSIALRIQLIKNNITREYLDSLHCDVEMFGSVEMMIRANYPQILRKKRSKKVE